jgi:signal transduction histidine kinase
MFDNNKSFSSYYPTVWNDVIGHDNGTLINEGTIYTFVTINQDDLSFKSDMKKISHSEHFKVVIKRKLSEAQYLPKNSNEVIFALLLFLVIIGISYRWSKAISGQKEAEFSVVKTHEALVQSEKMASLGRLVAGIAHELNTPIGSSVTIASTLQDELRVFENEINSGQIRKSVISHFLLSANSCTDAMMECLERASDLVTHFKRISVDQSTEARRKFTLPDYLNNVIATLEPTFKNRQITIDVYSRDTIEVDSFPGPFAQVISNIINNSVLHGFPSDTAGEIRISVNQNNNDVVITVRDNGVGISPDNLKKIFDPFFTTAADIGGSGLGMSIVYNIISEVLQGDISVNSKINEFTEFVIRMPRYVESMNKPEISHAR